MENKILDDFNENKIPRYAKKSFQQFCWSIMVYVFFIGITQAFLNLTMSFIFLTITLLVLIGGIVLNISGLRHGLKSIRLKENSNWRKYIGTIGNLLILLLVVVLFFVVSVDVYENFIR